ncbi:hypothetical protein [Dolichospermum circinale]|uniref:Uncharacterized protein n=1 Tax=Dolichospermum circinale CS-537/01 TaxID=3021739 RepID=A0ABT5A7Q3_9CYAN|nr:hypothetical protein [Dolichospermum circinale]MDB9466515.1 hypothetical protein [Dolichospermum circinale CS-539/09]MDB9472062.1 hypothetical protein [Dolichospermum circinale CS-539]MDB9487575.1 hypothetical protein [Dolichospermum circinale CS-537/01]
MDLFTGDSREVHGRFTGTFTGRSREDHGKFISSSREGYMKPMNRLPKEDLSSGQIAEFLGVSRKTVTSYYEKVRQAYFWLDESELSYGASNQKRYTQFCVAAIEDLFASENHQKWINDIQSSNKTHKANGSNDLPQPGGEIVSFVNNPESSALVVPEDFIPVEIEVIDPIEVRKYDLSRFTTANLTNVANLNTNKNNKLTALEQATTEKFRLMGKAAAQKAIHAYTAAFNEELSSLTED